ncbi:MAG: flagellar basal-body rod protein FlgG [Pseudomonadota bacterium]
MLDSLYIGASGMHAQQTNVDVISNNLANVNTSAFKKNRVSFEDLMYRETSRQNGLLGGSESVHRLGVGTGVSGTSKVFTAGELKKSDSPLDIAIRGQGFLEVTMPDGSSAYTRSGSMEVNRDGFLTTPEGYLLKSSIQIPGDATEIVIEPAGRVMVRIPTDKELLEVGQLDLVNFTNPGGLNPNGGNLYLASDRSGEALIGKPGENGYGTLAQSFLETSNVKLMEEMINLIIAQRAYEINAKVVQASDEMLGMSNNLRR